MKKKLTIVLVALLAVGLTYFAAYQQEPLRKYLPSFPTIGKQEPSVATPVISVVSSAKTEYLDVNDINEQDIEIRDLPMNPDLVRLENEDVVIQDDDILPMNETLVTPGFSYKVNSTAVSKKPIHFSPSEYSFYPHEVEKDKSGTITNAYSYIELNVTITCLKKKQADFLIASLTVRTIENGKANCGPELVADRCIENENKVTLKGHVFFEPQETLTFDFGFVIPDEFLNQGTLVFDSNYQGAGIAYLRQHGIKKEYLGINPEKIE